MIDWDLLGVNIEIMDLAVFLIRDPLRTVRGN